MNVFVVSVPNELERSLVICTNSRLRIWLSNLSNDDIISASVNMCVAGGLRPSRASHAG